MAFFAGFSLLGGATLGLYLLAAACVLKIGRAVMTAWMLMFGALQTKE